MIDERYVAEFEEQAVRGMNAEFTVARPATSLAKLVTEQEATAYPGHRKLSAEGLLRQASFEHDRVILGDHIASSSEALSNRWLPVHEAPPVGLADSLHVFGPDTGGTAGPNSYTLSWTFIEGGTGGAGIGASANVRNGIFSASHFTHGSNQFSAYAGLGVSIVPNLKLSTLSVRPLVNWSGFDILSSRVFDPQLNPRAWGVASAQIGLIVQSWDLAGNGFRTDKTQWTTVWNRSEINPSGSRNYSGSVDARELLLSVLVTSQRRYAIWVACRAVVITQAVFDLDIFSSASVSCQLPLLFVEELA
jgi:hypothetical protein